MKTMKPNQVVIGSGLIRFDPKTRSSCYKKTKHSHTHATHTNHNSHFHNSHFHNTHLLTQTLATLLNPQSHYTKHIQSPPTTLGQRQAANKGRHASPCPICCASVDLLLRVRRSAAAHPWPLICCKCRRSAERCYRSVFCCSKPSTQATWPEFLPFGSWVFTFEAFFKLFFFLKLWIDGIYG